MFIFTDRNWLTPFLYFTIIIISSPSSCQKQDCFQNSCSRIVSGFEIPKSIVFFLNIHILERSYCCFPNRQQRQLFTCKVCTDGVSQGHQFRETCQVLKYLKSSIELQKPQTYRNELKETTKVTLILLIATKESMLLI